MQLLLDELEGVGRTELPHDEGDDQAEPEDHKGLLHDHAVPERAVAVAHGDDAADGEDGVADDQGVQQPVACAMYVVGMGGRVGMAVASEGAGCENAS